MGKNRQPGLDILRSLALAFVVSVHFFLNNGFYSQPMIGAPMWIAACFRWLFFTCVPLFLLISGYLRSPDRPDRRYYGGIFRVILSWLFVSLISIAFQIAYWGTEKSLAAWIGDILNFQAANYSWYVEMYLGAFLLFPFINLAFHSLNGRGAHLLMTGSVCAVVFLPSVLCGFLVGDSVWNLFPDYWTGLYPFAYYLIGCYIREYRPKVPSALCLACAVLLSAVQGTLTALTAGGGNFGSGLGGGYSDLCVCAVSVLLFLGIYRIGENGKMPEFLRKLFSLVSRVSLDAYLISWVFDKLFYGYFGSRLEPGKYPLYYLMICVPVIILSVLAAWPLWRASAFLAGKLRRRLRMD